ncbi:hypothetical protein Dimus_025649 [Dionaea muscipula]
MTIQESLIQETYYDVLHVKEDASYEVIRASYRSALLSFHPDKLHNALEITPSTGDKQGDRFIKVQKAWEVLGNSRSRALYDSELQCLRDDAVVAEDMCLTDTVAEVTREVSEFSYPCNCGDSFSISFSELEEMGYEFSTDRGEIYVRSCSDCLPVSIILSCGSCSLRTRLLIPSIARVPVHNPNA